MITALYEMFGWERTGFPSVVLRYKKWGKN